MHESIFEPKELFMCCKLLSPFAFTLTLDLQLVYFVGERFLDTSLAHILLCRGLLLL